MMCKVLIFGCIAAVILMTAAYGAPLTEAPELSPAQKEECLKASIKDLKRLKNIENNYLDFYTPNDKQECNHKTLECYLKELNVLIQDSEGEDHIHLMNIKKNLQDFKVHGSSKLTCKKCEAHEKKKFPEFQQELSSFLQSLLK
ncbi:IL15 protein, partial [Malurus elegans]|nr:IL15 protein [Malurus elegans]